MTLLQSIILGIVQGISEFLPISSSAHLVIVPYLLGWDIPAEQAFVFDVLVQDATLVAVVLYFWKDLLQMLQAMRRGIIQRDFKTEPASRTGLMLIIATIPALVIGFFLKGAVEKVFADPLARHSSCWSMR
jgi:undecaprenyl-diphosphatase